MEGMRRPATGGKCTGRLQGLGWSAVCGSGVDIDNSCAEHGAERTELPEIRVSIGLMLLVMIVLTTVLVRVIAVPLQLRAEKETGRGQTSGTQDEGTSFANRRRHVAGGHDDTDREAEKNQPSQFASHTRVDN